MIGLSLGFKLVSIMSVLSGRLCVLSFVVVICSVLR